MVKIFDDNDRLIELQEDGQTVWTEEDSIRRDKISEKSQKELFNHIKNGEFEAYARKTFEILTGKTVKEFEGINNG